MAGAMKVRSTMFDCVRGVCVRVVGVLLGLWGVVVVSGCVQPYSIEGKVVRGDYSAVMVVPSSDPRFNGPGVAGARVHLQENPGRPNRETITQGFSGADGTFELVVDRFGAGWVEMDVGAYVRRDGYAPAFSAFELPRDSYRLLIVLTEGRDFDLGESRNLTDGFEDEMRW